jgi:hypothetical protein
MVSYPGIWSFDGLSISLAFPIPTPQIMKGPCVCPEIGGCLSTTITYVQYCIDLSMSEFVKL